MISNGFSIFFFRIARKPQQQHLKSSVRLKRRLRSRRFREPLLERTRRSTKLMKTRQNLHLSRTQKSGMRCQIRKRARRKKSKVRQKRPKWLREDLHVKTQRPKQQNRQTKFPRGKTTANLSRRYQYHQPSQYI